MEGEIPQKLQKKYISYLTTSPILFTAPHSKQLIRNISQRHKKEVFTSLLACDLAIQTGDNSFLFWGPSKKINQVDLDPNYLKKNDFHSSPFHQCLHAWALQNQGKPLLHIDIHGKADRSYNCQIQLGIRSMEVHWPKDPLISKIRIFFSTYENIFAGLKFGAFQCTMNTDTTLHGYWGSSVHTMTEQAILLGIPSIQVEIPFLVRKKLAYDKQLRKKFSNMIQRLYETVIVVDWQANHRKRMVQREIAEKFEVVVAQGEVEELSDQLFQFQTTGVFPVETINDS